MAKKSHHNTPEIYLSEKCSLMRRAIRSVGTYQLDLTARRQPYESLMRAVAHQQLNGTAAQTILGRFCALYPGRKFPRPDEVLATDPQKIRAAGFSGAKILSLRDIAEKTISGIVPTGRTIVTLSDEDIIERLTEVRGVGRWTVEMLLIFQLGRPDVLPVDDFGVRNGFRVLKKLPEMPKPKELALFGQKWAPHRTAAAWYLWRVADQSKLKKIR